MRADVSAFKILNIFFFIIVAMMVLCSCSDDHSIWKSDYQEIVDVWETQKGEDVLGYDMLDVQNKDLLKFVPNYPINLIAPAYIKDNDFNKFGTDLGLAMKVLKYQKAGAVEVIEETNHRKIDRNTAVFLNNVANLGLEFDEKEVMIDMCKAMDDNNRKMKISGAIEAYRDCGTSDEDIIKKIIAKFQVTKEYVLALLAPQKAG